MVLHVCLENAHPGALWRHVCTSNPVELPESDTTVLTERKDFQEGRIFSLSPVDFDLTAILLMEEVKVGFFVELDGQGRSFNLLLSRNGLGHVHYNQT